mmetsp:Transcript_141523/g.452453  ORF Transcript_141523/g.452453 Transcript_141523/m.452453 type:complete len:584 (+) Transcript_141523:465-2216(+)
MSRWERVLALMHERHFWKLCISGGGSSRGSSSRGLCQQATLQNEVCPQWREVNHGLCAIEIEGWPASKTRRRCSGHPNVKNHELQQVVSEVRATVREGRAPDTAHAETDTESGDRLARVRGLMRGILARPDAQFANELVGVLGSMERNSMCELAEEEFDSFAAKLLRRALRMDCPTQEEAVAELRAIRRSQGRDESTPCGTRASPMSRLTTELFPAWLDGEVAAGALEDRLRIGMECWEQAGCPTDIDGVGLYAAICLELGELQRVRKAMENLLDAEIDLRLSFQPLFLDCLSCEGCVDERHLRSVEGSLPDLVQRAARLAQRCPAAGVTLRRHGALLLRPTATGGFEILSEGFNHAARPLGPRGLDPSFGVDRTFASAEEAATAGLPLKLRKLRPAQRHAEIHCLLQLPRLEQAVGTEMLVVELADIGPGLRWAEPCSRGCMQLLIRHGVAAARFTDGQGGLHEQRLRYKPELDVPAASYAGTGRLRGDMISERACTDLDEKLQREVDRRLPKTLEEIVQSGAVEAAALRARAPLALRGRCLPLPRRKRRACDVDEAPQLVACRDGLEGKSLAELSVLRRAG